MVVDQAASATSLARDCCISVMNLFRICPSYCLVAVCPAWRMVLRILATALLYALYVYADFVAMMILAYNAFTEKAKLRPITIAVALLFLVFGMIVVVMLECMWKQLSRHNATNPPSHQGSHLRLLPQACDRHDDSVWTRILRVLIALLIWAFCFYSSTFVLWWLGEHQYGVPMFFLLVTVVPILDLWNSLLVRRALLPNWEVCVRHRCNHSQDAAHEENPSITTTETSQDQEIPLLSP